MKNRHRKTPLRADLGRYFCKMDTRTLGGALPTLCHIPEAIRHEIVLFRMMESKQFITAGLNI